MTDKELIEQAVSMAVAGTKRICAEEYEAAMAKMAAEMTRIAQDRIEALNAEVARLRAEATMHVQALQELCWVEIPEEKAALEAAIDFLWRVAGHD
jgi:N-methylhydantoinase B/oxoprolinase/acetone carboxylase alpha subunit